MDQESPIIGTSEVARRLGVRPWQVRRLFEAGKLPDVPRLGGRRILRESDLPAVRAALVAAGYLQAEAQPQSADASAAPGQTPAEPPADTPPAASGA